MAYRAKVGLTVPVNDAETLRIKRARDRGKPLPAEERQTRRVEAGEIAHYIPSESIPWLLEQGLIEEVADDSV